MPNQKTNLIKYFWNSLDKDDKTTLKIFSGGKPRFIIELVCPEKANLNRFIKGVVNLFTQSKPSLLISVYTPQNGVGGKFTLNNLHFVIPANSLDLSATEILLPLSPIDISKKSSWKGVKGENTGSKRLRSYSVNPEAPPHFGAFIFDENFYSVMDETDYQERSIYVYYGTGELSTELLRTKE